MPDTQDLDQSPHLPRRNWVSIVLVLVVQALNAFNDNFVKILLIALAPVVAGTRVTTFSSRLVSLLTTVF